MKRRIIMNRRITLAGIAIIAILVIALPAAAKTWYVDDNGQEYPDNDYTRISDAISESSDGDTIKVYAGTYNERLKIEKRLTLEGVGQPVIDAGTYNERLKIEKRLTLEGVDPPVIDAGGIQVPVVQILASDVVLRGFKITHPDSNTFGVSVGIDHQEKVERTIIEDNLIDRCHAGVWFTSGSTGSTLRKNTISNMNWAGLYNLGSSSNTIHLNNFINKPKVNAFTHGVQNEWSSQMTYTYQGNTYTGYMGNYWDDYDGADNDGDGIGDTAYAVYAGGSETDQHPLIVPFENYAAESGYLMIGDINGDGTTGMGGAFQDAIHLIKYSYSDPDYQEIFDHPDCNGDGTTGMGGAFQDTIHLIKYSYSDPDYPELYPGV